MKLYVGNLSFESTENDLQDLFQQHGTVNEVHLMMDRFTAKSRGFAFVTMNDGAQANAAMSALKAADVIFYDRLVGDGVLDHARREAELIPVGKAKGAHSVGQEEINALLIQRALAGETVVRLKGGDPFIFGRGGEELDALREAGIAIEIVPGVTAALAAAADLGVSLTRRGVSRNVAFATPRVGEGERASDWAAALGHADTAAVYMGARDAAAITAFFASR